MKTSLIILLFILTIAGSILPTMLTESNYHPEFNDNQNTGGMVLAYPPGVGILTKSKNCLACHSNKGPWGDESKLILDILEADTKKSLKQPDGSFAIEVRRNQTKTLLSVIGRSKDEQTGSPQRNAWIFVDPKTIETSSLSKFAPGWECNLPLSCRVVGDQLPGYEGAKITSLPMTIRPTDAARDGELQWQVMHTGGESVKGNAMQGIVGNYFERKVKLTVID